MTLMCRKKARKIIGKKQYLLGGKDHGNIWLCKHDKYFCQVLCSVTLWFLGKVNYKELLFISPTESKAGFAAIFHMYFSFHFDSNDKMPLHYQLLSQNFYHLINFKLLHIHWFLMFKLTAISNRDDGDGISRFHWLSLCHNLRHNLSIVVTQIIPGIIKKKV